MGGSAAKLAGIFALCVWAGVARDGLADEASRGSESAGAATDAAFVGLVDRVMALRLAGGLTVAGALAVIPESELRLREVLAERRQLSEPREPAPGPMSTI